MAITRTSAGVYIFHQFHDKYLTEIIFNSILPN